MKSNLFSLLFLLIYFTTFSQNSNDKTIYLDSLWNEIPQGNHYYYRLIKDYHLEKDNYKIYDYYKSGIIQMEGYSKSKDYINYDGEFTWYYDNGNKKKQLNYTDTKLEGKGTEWYENGLKKMEGEYIINTESSLSELKINQFWNAENTHTVINGNGIYEFTENDVYEKGAIKNGFRDGEWVGESYKIKYTFKENYADSKLVSGISIDSNNESHEYTSVFLNPKPEKDMKHFYKYIGEKFKINNEATKNNIYGKMLFTFVVEKDGRVDEVKVLKGLGYGLDEEAVKLIKKYNKWVPGEIRGIKVRVFFNLPIAIQKSE